MLPDPLHPAVVHLPIALAVLIPAFALLVALCVWRGLMPARRTWLAIVLLQGLLLSSGWLAMETGEAEEDRVERAVAERPIEEHEEMAEQFVGLAGVVLIIATLGMLRGSAGALARASTVAGSVLVLLVGFRVGHSGGELVYGHGAASVYVAKADRGVAGHIGLEGHADDDDSDD